MDDMLGDLRSMEPMKGHDRVMVPGDPEAIAHADRSERGIPVHPVVVDELRTMGEAAGVNVPF
jgi:LDH2 family malate/lactate/ureidoglycolate dehydrogenase